MVGIWAPPAKAGPGVSRPHTYGRRRRGAVAGPHRLGDTRPRRTADEGGDHGHAIQPRRPRPEGRPKGPGRLTATGPRWRRRGEAPAARSGTPDRRPRGHATPGRSRASSSRSPRRDPSAIRVRRGRRGEGSGRRGVPGWANDTDGVSPGADGPVDDRGWCRARRGAYCGAERQGRRRRRRDRFGVLSVLPRLVHCVLLDATCGGTRAGRRSRERAGLECHLSDYGPTLWMGSGSPVFSEPPQKAARPTTSTARGVLVARHSRR